MSSYFDVNGSTPLMPEVAEAYRDAADWCFGNPSAGHPEGRRARVAIESARAQVAQACGCDPDQVVFTSGGTESNNWAVRGAHLSWGRPGGHVVVSAIEHKSVLESVRALEAYGVQVTAVECGPSGVVDPERMASALREETFLVALMLANNETGVLQSVEEVARACRSRGVPLLCDAVTALGKVPLQPSTREADLISLSAHKMYGPKGVGALIVRTRPSGRTWPCFHHGCGQQSGLRSGTENTPGIVAFGLAAERVLPMSLARAERIGALRDRLWHALAGLEVGASRNGRGPALPNTLSVAFEGRSGVELQAALAARGVSVAIGAAASTGQPSHVLSAMGLGRDRARSTLRFSLGTFHDQAAIDSLVEHLAQVLRPQPSASYS